MLLEEVVNQIRMAPAGREELDRLIEREVASPMWRQRCGREEIMVGDEGMVRISRAEDYIPRIAPAYTRSLDAAVKLVGDRKWTCGLDQYNHEGAERYGKAWVQGHGGATARTPELALCIAALLARGSAK